MPANLGRIGIAHQNCDASGVSGASGVSEVLNDAASIYEVGIMPPGSWQSRWSERRHRTGADDRQGDFCLLACVLLKPARRPSFQNI